jgi:hypothetical protein
LTFGDSVLPPAPVARAHGRNSAGAQEVEDFGAKLRIAIENEVLALGTVGKRLAELLNDPRTGGWCVVLKWMISRRSWRIKNKQYRMRKFAVMTVKKSIPTMTSW